MRTKEGDPRDQLKAVSAMLTFLADAVLTIAWYDELSPSAAEGFYHVRERIRAEIEEVARLCRSPRPREGGGRKEE